MSNSSSSSLNLEKVRCRCGFVAKESIAHTELNYGRRFFGCPMYGSGKQWCKFFKWRDDSFDDRAIQVINELVSEKKEVMELRKRIVVVEEELKKLAMARNGNVNYRFVFVVLVCLPIVIMYAFDIIRKAVS